MMRKITIAMIFVAVFTLLLAACGGGGDDASDTAASSTNGETAGDAARGEELYKQTTIGAASAPGCITCHSLDEGVTLVGPSHANIGAVAESRVAGLSAEEYLRQSIVEPDAEVTDGFSPGVMYQNYDNDLSADEIDDLVAFLLTLQ